MGKFSLKIVRITVPCQCLCQRLASKPLGTTKKERDFISLDGSVLLKGYRYPPKTVIRFTVEENHIGSVVREILCYTEKSIRLLLCKDKKLFNTFTSVLVIKLHLHFSQFLFQFHSNNLNIFPVWLRNR